MATPHDLEPAKPLPDVKVEADRVVDLSGQQGITVRLLGGIAIARRCPSASRPPLAREYNDIDLAIRRSSSRRLSELLQRIGYEPDKSFNTFNGDRRLLFLDGHNTRQLDVFIDTFQMCHTFDLRDRIDRNTGAATLPLADLLLTKMQVVELNFKDMQDIAALLQDHPFTESDDGINLPYITSLTGKDWGIQHTLELNIERLRSQSDRLVSAGAPYALAGQLDRLDGAMRDTPKSVGWKIRAKVGERMPWHELPEEHG